MELGKLIYEKRLLEIADGNNDAAIDKIDRLIEKLRKKILDMDTSVEQ